MIYSGIVVVAIIIVAALLTPVVEALADYTARLILKINDRLTRR